MIFDGKYAYDITARLSYPRMVGSDGNAKARDQIEQDMREIGLDVAREDFSASDFPMGVLARWAMLTIAAPLLVGALAYQYGHYLIGMIFALITAAIAWKVNQFAANYPEMARYGNHVPTQNLTGSLKGGDKGHVVLMAHFDTKSQPFPIEFRIIAFLLGGLGIVITMAWLLIGSLGALFHLWSAGSTGLLVVGIITAAVSASLLWNKVENFSDGSLDNAAGVGVIMALAKTWAKEPPKELSLSVVATSAEEWGLQGAERWIEKHAPELDVAKTIFLNYDGPGSKAGRIIFTSTFGLPRRQISGPELKADFEAACRELSITNAKDVYIPFGASTDMVPVSQRGFKVLNIGSLTTGVHTTRDNISTIDANELQKAGDIGVKVIGRFKARMKQD